MTTILQKTFTKAFSFMKRTLGFEKNADLLRPTGI